MISKPHKHEETDVEFDATDTFEALDEDGEEVRATDKISQLKKRLTESEEAKRDLHEELQRAKADFLNARRRLSEEQERNKERVATSFIEELLPLCDSFYMAMSDKEAWNAVDTVWRTGVESIYAQLQSILNNHSVTIISPLGEPFDPERHEAVASVPTTDKTSHHVITAVLQPGYQITHGSRTDIIRPARVVVSDYTDA